MALVEDRNSWLLIIKTMALVDGKENSSKPYIETSHYSTLNTRCRIREVMIEFNAFTY